MPKFVVSGEAGQDAPATGAGRESGDSEEWPVTPPQAASGRPPGRIPRHVTGRPFLKALSAIELHRDDRGASEVSVRGQQRGTTRSLQAADRTRADF